jgi:hypothetical protein
MLAVARRVQVAIQTRDATPKITPAQRVRKPQRRRLPARLRGIDVSAPNEIGRRGSTGRTRSVSSADAPPVDHSARRLRVERREPGDDLRPPRGRHPVPDDTNPRWMRDPDSTAIADRLRARRSPTGEHPIEIGPVSPHHDAHDPPLRGRQLDNVVDDAIRTTRGKVRFEATEALVQLLVRGLAALAQAITATASREDEQRYSKASVYECSCASPTGRETHAAIVTDATRCHEAPRAPIRRRKDARETPSREHAGRVRGEPRRTSGHLSILVGP